MRKLRVSILLIIVGLFMLVPMISPTQKVKAIDIPRIYSVYADYCDFGPWSPYGYLLGEWTRDCDNTYYGWGFERGEPCTYTTYVDLDCD